MSTSNTPTIHVSAFPAEACADWLIARVAQVIAERGHCRIGLPGGSTPIPMLARLAEKMPASLYSGLRVTWVDDRHVPLDDLDSNFALAQKHWFAEAPAPVQHLPMWRGGDLRADRDAFAMAFAADFDAALDVVVLGVGEDGHVASIFPEDLLDRHADGAVAAIAHAPKPPPQRITLTLPVFDATPHLALLVTGASKAPVMGRAADGDRTLPVGRLSPQGEFAWFLDAPAAHGLTPTIPPRKS
jgi:6-phosphogluconolactonase